MTANELYVQMNEEYGLQEWPKTREVDTETFAHVCAAVIRARTEWDFKIDYTDKSDPIALVRLGPHGGIMFKNVELIEVGRPGIFGNEREKVSEG